ncbi:MerR family DNA-binding transcriptional regulator [Bartonella tamiae]|uniref:Cu(I)-responsive transcriptional regulator n=1 Tax=Bartonella tamiae Th239 TaxID=1094558 RepID=J0R1B4_9HYPH|nr:MerR family transcriptional regulator [Bartonella tamiae]EJF89344.1 Cu(I)-responsive transcriptional regulator [Bartonella tamiae Th239]EJF92791.1 Cu(I)-responsive transcriptional regulator [Bartonella tamiae Th307]
MDISEAAKQSGLSAKMIRRYEDIALIAPAQRTQSGYRVYCLQDIVTFKFIRLSRLLGFSISEIQKLLELWNNHDRASSNVKTLTLLHIDKFEEKQRISQKMIHTLKELADHYQGIKHSDCPILESLAS